MVQNVRGRVLSTSAWALYTIIVLEILFMVSPFAAFYYSIYASPLNALQSMPATAWLTYYLLPHFSYSESQIANVLILASWPLIIFGLLLFVLGFCQIYWAKFTSRGAVDVGLYRYIRHPQYLALAIVGLGTALFWSRYIVVLAFVTMLFLYYGLARLEEDRCLKKFGDAYRTYMARTGMFWPRSVEQLWSRFGIGLPGTGLTQLLSGLVIYLVTLAFVIAGGSVLRAHVIDGLVTRSSEARMILFLAPFEENQQSKIETLLDHKLSEASPSPLLVYVAPSNWRVPELGLIGDQGENPSETQELMHPTTHGNPLPTSVERVQVLVTKPVLDTPNVMGHQILAHTMGIVPLQVVYLDLESNQLVSFAEPEPGPWASIPVPTF